MSSIDDLPPALPAIWRALERGYRAEPRLLAVSFGLALLAALPDALLALGLKILVDGARAGDGAQVVAASAGLGAAAASTWFLSLISTRVQRRFRDRVTIALESHVARLQASVATVEHHERPEYLDRLSVLRNQVFVLDHMYMSLFTTCGWVLRLGVTLALLASIHPALAALLVFALPTVLSSTWRPAVERAAEERGAAASRLARHLFDTATTAPPGKEVRVTGIGERLERERRAAFERWYAPVASARWGSALWSALGWGIFGCAYVGAVVFVSVGLRAGPGDVLLVLAAGARLSSYIAATVGEIGFLRGIWLDGSQRMAWLEDYAARALEGTDLRVPDSLGDGIRFERVSFAYPGSERLVLEDVDLHLTPGSVVALVGENGAGKSTLVKLLCRMYRPTRGRILVDGVDLARVPPEAWRARLAGAFQDFFRFELRARHSVGVGDVPRLDDPRAVQTAVARAGAGDVVQGLPAGLDSQLGASWPEGADLSFGQWQKLALARGFMRDEPFVLVLDEPTAALDAETEHALFEKYASAPRKDQITLLVSHRFSTVRMADTIIVLDGARVAETGTHEALMARGGPYAELYAIQAAAYR
jgi:ATP-binding cassette, subfamily B, bacterial